MRQKKGISPLIATVLILGFTVALAAVIMVWGQRFTVGIQKQTEETATIQLNCATDVDLKLVSVCNRTCSTCSSWEYRVTAQNDQAGKITKLILRFSNASSVNTTNEAFAAVGGIPGYGTVTQIVGGIEEASYVEAIPVAIINGKETTCSANKQSVGEQGGPAFDNCV